MAGWGSSWPYIGREGLVENVRMMCVALAMDWAVNLDRGCNDDVCCLGCVYGGRSWVEDVAMMFVVLAVQAPCK